MYSTASLLRNNDVKVLLTVRIKNDKVKELFYSRGEVRTVKSSLQLNFQTKFP